ncbi:hypothetical protein WJX84_003877 [Apatococcus fuscideae]|uniref:Uncharacterized protein n=1 Tax=Apatococcus fuscideae TaxID=2026836 RepID=A0AAW1SMH5_9CHLO
MRPCHVRPAVAAVEKLVGALYQVQAAMAQLTASVTNLLRLKDWILLSPVVIKALRKEGLLQLVATCAEVLLSKEALTTALQDLGSYALPMYNGIYSDHSNGELAWQRMAARTKEKLRRSAVLKQRAATAKLLRAYEDEDYRKQFLAYMESAEGEADMRKFTPTKASSDSRPSTQSRPITPAGFTIVDGQAIPIFASESVTAASIISGAAGERRATRFTPCWIKHGAGLNLNSLLAAASPAAAAQPSASLPQLRPPGTPPPAAGSPLRQRPSVSMQALRQHPGRVALAMHHVPLSAGPQLPEQLLPTLPFSLPVRPQGPSIPSFTPLQPVGPGCVPPMQLNFKHQAGSSTPHANLPLQQYVDDVLHHRRDWDTRRGSETAPAHQPAPRGPISAVGHGALRLNR